MRILEVLDRQLYTPAFAARLVDLEPSRVRRWLRGYDYAYHSGRNKHPEKRHQAPVVRRSQTRGERYASFLDLIDLLFIRGFVNEGISLQKLRRALEEADRLSKGHRFAHEDFWTDGRRIFLQVENQGKALLQLLSGGQWTIKDVVKRYAKQIDFSTDSGMAERWFPLGKTKPIVIDPRIGFGAPTILDKNITTANIYDLYIAENEDIGRVEEWFELGHKQVQSAVEFEKRIAA